MKAEVANGEGIRDMRTAHWLAEDHGVAEDAVGDAGAGAVDVAGALAAPWPQRAPRYQRY